MLRRAACWSRRWIRPATSAAWWSGGVRLIDLNRLLDGWLQPFGHDPGDVALPLGDSLDLECDRVHALLELGKAALVGGLLALSRVQVLCADGEQDGEQRVGAGVPCLAGFSGEIHRDDI